MEQPPVQTPRPSPDSVWGLKHSKNELEVATKILEVSPQFKSWAPAIFVRKQE
jgi:hypothetical protein